MNDFKNIKRLILFLPVFLLISGGCNKSLPAATDIAIKDAYANAFKIGVAVNSFNITDRDSNSRDIILKHFNALSPENDLKPESLHPRPDVWNFERADAYVKFGEDNDMWMLGHTLCWHNQTPDFFWKNDNGEYKTKEELYNTIEEYIKTVCTHFLGKIDAWDVINEIISEEGKYRNEGWVRALGGSQEAADDFVKHVYRCAEKYAPGTDLYYNEFNVWRPSKLDGIVRMVKMLKSDGIKIDGVGIQAHWGLNYPKNEYIENAIDALASLGVKVMITELDVDVLPLTREGQLLSRVGRDPIFQMEEFKEYLDPYIDGLPDSVEDKLAARYEELFKIFYNNSDKIDRVTLWGVHDGMSWKNGAPIPRRTNYPLLFQRDYAPHKAFYSIINVPGTN